MTIYFLGSGPITLQIYADIVSEGHRATVVTNSSVNRNENLESLTYAEFCLRNISSEDKVVIAWRSLGGGAQSTEKEQIIENLNRNLKYASKVIYLSSGSVYGDAENTFTETMPVAPQTSYAKAKLKIENWLLEIGNPATIICRISNVFGLPDLPNLIDKIVNSLDLGEPMQLFDPERFTRDYISVRAVARSIIFLLLDYESQILDPEFINISSNCPITTTTVVKFVNKALGRKFTYDAIEIPPGIPVSNCLDNQKLLDILKAQFDCSPLEIEDYIQLRLKGFEERLGKVSL